MCLHTIQRTAKIAQKSITVYKVLFRDNQSPYWYTKYERGKTYKSSLRRNQFGKVYIGLHSFVTKKEARAHINEGGTGDKVVEMKIPKGARYFSGHFLGRGSYASTALKFPVIKRKVSITKAKAKKNGSKSKQRRRTTVR